MHVHAIDLGPSYMVLVTSGNPPLELETTLVSIYNHVKMVSLQAKSRWPCIIIHNPYRIIKRIDAPLSLGFPRSVNHTGFCKLISLLWYKFLLNLGILWHLLHRKLSPLGKPNCLFEEKLFPLPGLPYLLRWVDSLPETTWGHAYKWLFKSYNDTRKVNLPKVTQGRIVSGTRDRINGVL